MVVFLVNEDDSTDRIVLEDETTRGDQYDGKVIVQESGSGIGDITDLFLTNGGNQYTSLPTVSVTTSTGSSVLSELTVMKLVKL